MDRNKDGFISVYEAPSLLILVTYDFLLGRVPSVVEALSLATFYYFVYFAEFHYHGSYIIARGVARN